MPGYYPERAVLFHTEEAILVVGKFDVYLTGATFSIDLQLHTEDDDIAHNMPWERQHRARGRDALPDDDLPDELIRLGIVFADGSSWSNLDAWYPTWDEAPAGPVLMSRGGGGGGNSWSMEQWLWPLPPEGELTFVTAWPKYGIAETTAVLDATALRAAANDAIRLWS